MNPHTGVQRARRESAGDAVARAIEAKIAEEQLPAGHRVGTKSELCAVYQVAPATLGEALRLLRARDIVDVRPGPGGGAFVARQPPLARLAQQVLALRENGATANDVLAVLDMLDEAIIRDAAQHRRADDLRDLNRLCRHLERVWRDPSAGPQANWQLHRRIADISPNPILRVFYLNLVDYLQDQMNEPSVTAAGFDPMSIGRLRLHLDIVDAIKSRDERAVRDVVRRHAAPV